MLTAATLTAARQVDNAGEAPEFFVILVGGIVVVGAFVLGVKALGELIGELYGGGE